MKRLELSLLIGLVVAILLGNVTSFAEDCEDVRQSVFRLHILANSDSEPDQALKYAVRDKLLQETGELFAGASPEEAKTIAAEKLPELQALAAEVIQEEGYAYSVTAEVANMHFDTRVYGEDQFPAGRYDALRITIGEGNGRNWWCVLYPPLCLPAATKGEAITVSADGDWYFTDEELRVLKGGSTYKAEFAIVEWYEALKAHFTKEKAK